MKKILVIGGTGFIGYHVVQEMIKQGHEITVLALPPLPLEDLFPTNVHVILDDFGKIPDVQFMDILRQNDAVVFAAGADERILPKAPAYDFFYRANVLSCVRLVRLANASGNPAVVLVGSYFAYFDRVSPEMKLSIYHPYIRSRVEQEVQALAAATNNTRVVILELPYIFGAMPGRKPLWTPLVRYIKSSYPLFFTRGGTNMIAVERVAEAINGAVENESAQGVFTIGDVNLSWKDWLVKLSEFTGRRKKIHVLPDALIRMAMRAVHMRHHLNGCESGLHPVRYVEFQTKHTYFDPTPSQKILGYQSGGLDQALEKTVIACLSNG